MVTIGSRTSVAQAVVVAVSEYENYPPLPLARAAASALADSLAQNGYRVENRELLDGGESGALGASLGRLLRSIEANGTLLLYWTGHGVAQGDGAYLLGRESPQGTFSAFNAVDAKAIGTEIAACPAEKILVLIDACYSGGHANEIALAAARVLATISKVPGRQRAIAVIAAASAQDQTPDGAFGEAVRRVLFEPSNDNRSWTDRTERIRTDELATSINALLRVRGEPDPVEHKADGLGFEFVPNPRHRPNAVAENVEEQAWRLALSAGEAEHFNIAARGIEVGQSGWFFAGRKQLLRSLVDWLESAPNGLRIVTGPPGAGKSAVMGRLATLSDPEHRRMAEQAGALPPATDRTIPPPGALDVAVHAKGKTVEQVTRQVGQALGINLGKGLPVDPEKLVGGIGVLGRRVTIMIDALDEAAGSDAHIIAGSLIVPLSRLAGVRLLVGTRRSLDGRTTPVGEERHARLRTAFGVEAVVDDLEDEPEETADDIAEYVRLRLQASYKHRGRPKAEIDTAARRVALKAAGVFLYARIISRTLQELDRLDGPLPATALDAFVEDLEKRFGEDAERVNDLLAALAWGQGSGLTRRVWPRVANAFAASDHPYGDDDIAFVLSRAGWHIIEAGEDGQAVYRLGHEALADFYRSMAGVHATEAQGKIVAELTTGIEKAGWFDSDRYLWRHLAKHAAASGSLGTLIRDPGYLAVADSASIVALLPQVRDAESRRFADIYNRTADRLIERRPIDRLPLIHMTALLEDSSLAPTLEPPVATAWRSSWARGKRTAAHRIIGRHDHEQHAYLGRTRVTALTTGVIGDRLAIAYGTSTGMIRLWDTVTGRSSMIEGPPERVTSIAIGTVDDVSVIVASYITRVRFWDPETRAQVNRYRLSKLRSATAHFSVEAIDRPPYLRSFGYISPISIGDEITFEKNLFIDTAALAIVNDRVILATAVDHRSKAMWSPLAPDDIVTAIGIGRDRDRILVVSGSLNKTVRVWDAPTGKPTGNPLAGHKGYVTAVAFGSVNGQGTIVSGDITGTIRLWDWATGVAPADPIRVHSGEVSSLAIDTSGKPINVVSGGRNGAVHLLELGSGKAVEPAFSAHTGVVTAVGLGRIEGRPVAISGGDDATVRMWDMAAPARSPAAESRATTSFVATEFAVVDGYPVFVSVSDEGGIHCWDAFSGEMRKEKRIERTALDGRCIGVGVTTSRPKGLWASGASMLLLDAGNGSVTSITGKAGSYPTTCAFGEMDRRPIVVVGSSMDGTMGLWDASNGQQISDSFEGDTSVLSLAIGQFDGRPVLVGGCRGTLCLWDLRSGRLLSKPIQTHTWITAVAFGKGLDESTVVAGDMVGSLSISDLKAGSWMTLRHVYHTAAIECIGTGIANRRPIVASGGKDRTVRIWDLWTLESYAVVTLPELVSTVSIGARGKIAATFGSGMAVFEVASAGLPR